MKVFAYILSFIILALSCLPCSDGNAVGEKNTKHNAIVNVLEAKHDAEHADLCNPFCSCSCCGIIQLNQKIRPLELPGTKYNTDHLASFSKSAIITIALPIWQPPQLFA